MNVLLSPIILVPFCAVAGADTIATLALHNPTESGAPAVVEVPVGRIAAPGLIDWQGVRLVGDRGEIPFSVREGRAHWRAKLLAPVTNPRAEDILTFVLAVPPGETRHVRILTGAPASFSAIARSDGAITIEYPAVRAVVDEATGVLTDLAVRGVSLLSGPLSVSFDRLASPGYLPRGSVGPGYHSMTVEVQRAGTVPHRAQWAGESSSGAMTELHWVLDPTTGPAVGLTYRIHASGTVEILADERPWQGRSPWLDHAVSWSLPVAGTRAPLPYIETHSPFYGFKDHAAAFRQTGHLWRNGAAGLVEIGDEAVNGRRWSRHLTVFSNEGNVDTAGLVSLLDEGLVITVMPKRMPLTGAAAVSAPPEATALRERLLEVLRDRGLTGASTRLDLVLVRRAGDLGMEDDGFVIRRSDKGGAELVSATRLGLYQAVRAVDDHLALHGSEAGLPLVAGNPVVPLRAGGFGGGNFEVDFPYGSEQEWKRVFDGLLDSGMNVLGCLGMWGNWKMPVRYRYMPELYAGDPEAYDESTGVRFSELESHRNHALRLVQYVRERGGRVWLWLPIGCVPTTFAAAHPDAMKPGAMAQFWGRAKGTPCFTHPTYLAYLEALLRELMETYPIEGLVLVRDDNGTLCDCERCKAFTRQSRTGQPVWEQYLILYDMLKRLGFPGRIAVYPYFDAYSPEIEERLPEDLYIVGHGASIAGLTRSHELVGHMPDTWLDNLYTNFRLPSSPRVRRMLSDRGTFWIGGAYCATELPWQGVGYYGWQPTATPNTFRHTWAVRTLGGSHAAAFVALSRPYERLWDINARWMLPRTWLALSDAGRAGARDESRAVVARYRAALETLAARLNGGTNADLNAWLAHLRLFPVFFEYHQDRLDCFTKMHGLVSAHRGAVERAEGLPSDVRRTILDHYAVIYGSGRKYDQAASEVPGGMMEATRGMTLPYKEWMAGYDSWLDPYLVRPQFAGSLRVTPNSLPAGKAFTLNIELINTGVCPWVPEAEQRLALAGAASKLGLPDAIVYQGAPIAPGERGTLQVAGTAPAEPGRAQVVITWFSPYRVATKIAEQSVEFVWE